MPPFLAAAAAPAIIQGAAGLAGTIFGNNQRQADYKTQRRDTLDFWNKQNKYNSPENQMQLLKEAGLNPNLAYGKGFTSAGAGPLTSPDLQLGQYRNPGIDVLETIGKTQDFTVKQAQTDLVKAQADKAAEETLMIKIQKVGEKIKNAVSQAEFDEWLNIDVQGARIEKKSWEGFIAQKEANLIKDKYDIGAIEKQIFMSMESELRKYRILMPEQEYNLIKERIGYLKESKELQAIYVGSYEIFKTLGVAGGVGKALLTLLMK